MHRHKISALQCNNLPFISIGSPLNSADGFIGSPIKNVGALLPAAGRGMEDGDQIDAGELQLVSHGS